MECGLLVDGAGKIGPYVANIFGPATAGVRSERKQQLRNYKNLCYRRLGNFCVETFYRT